MPEYIITLDIHLKIKALTPGYGFPYGNFWLDIHLNIKVLTPPKRYTVLEY